MEEVIYSIIGFVLGLLCSYLYKAISYIDYIRGNYYYRKAKRENWKVGDDIVVFCGDITETFDVYYELVNYSKDVIQLKRNHNTIIVRWGECYNNTIKSKRHWEEVAKLEAKFKKEKEL